ncbi:DUF1045 domain-containing protein [Devosia sp.]|uniref:DUF1045 domain-containing protein n=1 Tax=Devosia sp. TaxID=1871048 RepID=UPI003265A9DE
MRCAICFIPPADDVLTIAAGRWLRRDPYSGARIAHMVEGLAEKDHAFLTAAPRRIGFHGSLKASFRLDPERSIDELEQFLAKFCRRVPPITVDPVRIALIHNFFALIPAAPAPELNELAADFVTVFDQFRAPLTDLDMARGDIGRLSGRQFNNLMSWGHPHVLDEFRFHMALSGPIDELERDYVAFVLQRHFGDLATAPLQLGQVALFVEPEPNAPFLIHSTHQFTAHHQRKTA